MRIELAQALLNFPNCRALHLDGGIRCLGRSKLRGTPNTYATSYAVTGPRSDYGLSLSSYAICDIIDVVIHQSHSLTDVDLNEGLHLPYKVVTDYLEQRSVQTGASHSFENFSIAISGEDANLPAPSLQLSKLFAHLPALRSLSLINYMPKIRPFFPISLPRSLRALHYRPVVSGYLVPPEDIAPHLSRLSWLEDLKLEGLAFETETACSQLLRFVAGMHLLRVFEMTAFRAEALQLRREWLCWQPCSMRMGFRTSHIHKTTDVVRDVPVWADVVHGRECEGMG